MFTPKPTYSRDGKRRLDLVTEPEIAEYVRLEHEGKSALEIAGELKRHPNTVNRYLDVERARKLPVQISELATPNSPDVVAEGSSTADTSRAVDSAQASGDAEPALPVDPGRAPAEVATAAQGEPDDPAVLVSNPGTPEPELASMSQDYADALRSLGLHAGICGDPGCTPCVLAIAHIQEATASEIHRAVFTDLNEAAEMAGLAQEAEAVGQAYLARQRWIREGRPEISEASTGAPKFRIVRG